MDSLNFFVVVSYKTDSYSSFPDVVVNGMYPNISSALERQLDICGGQHKPSGADNNSVYGSNGMVSWIKKLSIGHLNNWNVRSPDRIIYQDKVANKNNSQVMNSNV